MRERILKVLIEANKEIENNPDANFLTEGLLDSFEIVNLVMDLEDEFEIEIDPEDVIPDNFDTLDAITMLIEKVVNG